jgi:hypothetical protein
VAKIPVGIRLGAAQAMVEMSDLQHEANFPAAVMQGAQERNGIRAA